MEANKETKMEAPKETTSEMTSERKWKEALENAKAKKRSVVQLSNDETPPFEKGQKTAVYRKKSTGTQQGKKTKKPFMKRIEEEVKINGRQFNNVKYVPIYKESKLKRTIRKINGSTYTKKTMYGSFEISK